MPNPNDHIRQWLLDNYRQYDTNTDLRLACRRETKASATKVRHIHNGLTRRGKAVIAETARVKRAVPQTDQGIIEPEKLLNDLDLASHVEEYLDSVVGDRYIEQPQLMDNLEFSERHFRAAVRDPRFDSRKITINDRRSPSKRITIWSSKNGIEKIRTQLRGTR